VPYPEVATDSCVSWQSVVATSSFLSIQSIRDSNHMGMVALLSSYTDESLHQANIE